MILGSLATYCIMDEKLQGKLNAFFFLTPIESNFLGHQMAEIYRDKIYAPYVEGKENLVILDIGANLGLTAYYFSQFAKIVYALEPSTPHFDCLARMITFNEIKNIKPIKKAVFIDSEKHPFGGPKDNTTMKSLHMATWAEGKPEEVVDCITLDKLFEDEKIDHVNLMKLDIEGTECEVLSSLGFSKVASKIDIIIGEQHQWSGRHPHQLKEALKNNNFTLEEIPGDAQLFVAKRNDK